MARQDEIRKIRRWDNPRRAQFNPDAQREGRHEVPVEV
jgi:hypothetical protein